MSISYKQQDFVNIKDFGAKGDGSTDDTAAIQSAINTGKPIFIPYGNYVCDQVTFIGNAIISGPGVILHASDSYAITVAPTLPTPVACTITTVAATSGSLMHNTTQLVATSHGLVVGDVIKVSADATYSYSASAYVAEMARVQRVVDANTVVLDHQIEDFATSATSIKYFKVPRHIVDINVNMDRYGSLVGTTDYPVIAIFSAINPKVVLNGKKLWGTGIYAIQCWGGSLAIYCDDIDQDTTVAGRIGYGVVVGGASRGVSVTGSVSGSRHAVTSLNFANGSYDETKLIYCGISTDINVHDMVSTGSNLTAFDTHEMARRWTFNNCKAIGMVPKYAAETTAIAFFDRGIDTSYYNCIAHNCRVAFQLSGGESGHAVGTNYNTISNPIIHNATYAAFSVSNTAAIDTQVITISNPTVKSCYQAVYSGIKTNFIITGGYISSNVTMFNVYGAGNIIVSGTHLKLNSASFPFIINNSAGTRKARFIGVTFDGTARGICRLFDGANTFSIDMIDCQVLATLSHNIKENDATTQNNVFVVLSHTSTGSPESVWDADIGSRFFRTDGGASTACYIKESGVANTGWVAK